MLPIRSRLTYANVVASLSLFVALGGGAYAANMVTSADIVDETIQTQDIAKRAVTLDRMHDYSVNSAKVVDGSLAGVDVANSSLTSSDVANDSLTGADLDLGVHTVTKTTASWDAARPHEKTVTVNCPAGETALGGGAQAAANPLIAGLSKEVQLLESSPDGDGSWHAWASASDGAWKEYWVLTAYVRCAAI